MLISPDLDDLGSVKLSEYVMAFLASRGVTHVFGMSGGAAVHLFDAASRHRSITPVFSQHEQASAIAADGYGRATGRLGVAISTSGPGATNLLTGTACSYYDSVPVMMITGQVATHRLKGDRAVRQMGFQETDVLSVFSSVTKYAVQISDPNTIRYHLEEAYHVAFDGRPGAVLIDIPDDLQRRTVVHGNMPGHDRPETCARETVTEIDTLIELLQSAARPALVLGGGLTTPWSGEVVEALVDRLGIPVLQTWAGLSVLSSCHPLRVGPFGVYGPRLGNFVVQNADLLLCIGTRLSQNVTGGILPAFARDARIVMVDVCPAEMDKFEGRGIDVALRIPARAGAFISDLLQREIVVGRLDEWHAKIDHWRKALPNDRGAANADDPGPIDASDLVETLSVVMRPDETLFVDTGGTLTWTCNGIRLRKGQRLHSAWNYTPMGYALPAAIGGSFAREKCATTCVIGDGGLMLCLGELASLRRHELPIKVILFDNRGHGIQKQTLETWLGGHYVGVDEASGLAFGDFRLLAEAFDLPVVKISRKDEIAPGLRRVYEMEGPVFCHVEVRPGQRLLPFLKFGSPLEDQQPPLPKGVLEAEMIIASFKGGDADPRPSVGV